MKRTLILMGLLLFAVSSAWAQNRVITVPDNEYVRTFTGNATDTCRPVTVGVRFHTIRWEVSGTVSGGTVKVQGSNDSNCSSVTDIIAAQTATSSGAVEGTAATYAYVQMVFASYAGTGSVRAYYSGSKSGGSSVTVTSGTVMILDSQGNDILATTDDCDGVVWTSERYVSDAMTEDENEYSATAATLCAIEIANAHATAGAWVKCTNLTAANTTPGTSAIVWDFFAAPNGTSGNNKIGLTFSTAITCYIVLGKTAAAVDEVAADDVHVVLYYVN